MATTRFQPPPTYALPVIEDPRSGVGVFNPIWLKWFLDLSQNLGVDGAGGGSVVIAVSPPLVVGPGPTYTISMPAATSLTSGYLTATDWVSFNSRQAAGNYLVNGGTLGTPSGGTLTNVTGLPATGVVGTALVTAAIGTTVQAYDADLTTWAGVTPGTGVTTALEVNVGTAGAFVVNGGALGTPSSGTLTNCTGLPATSVVGTAPVTKVADFTVAAGETWLINNKASACVVTLPAAASFIGRTLTFHNYQAFTLTSISSNVVPQGGGTAGTAILLGVAGNWATLVSDGTNWVIMQAAAYNNLLLE